MGLIKYGPLADEVSGTVGGVTFARTYTGKSCRTWRAPTNKRTTPQLTQRSYLARLAHSWFVDLSSTQRDDWDAYAATCPLTNPLGETYYLNGFNTFIRHGTITWRYAASWNKDAPTQPGFPGIPTLGFTFVHADHILKLSSWAPAPVTNERLFFTIHCIRPTTQVFPIQRAIGTHGVIWSDALPDTLYTFNAFPAGLTGLIHTVLSWYFYDQYRRISTRQWESVPTTA